MTDTLPRFDWRKNLVLFGFTLWSVFATGRMHVVPDPNAHVPWYAGWTFAVPLMLILLAHEFGHYIAARIHRVPASLPFFLPLPPQLGSPFGTLGAIILMPGRIRSARALLDIGAAGPLAGMLVAIPTMIIGLKLSHVGPRLHDNFIQEGQSLLYMAIKRLTLGPISDAEDVALHPTAFAAWAGFFVTAFNLLPFMQFDGGHVAYALLGKRHHAISRNVWWLPLAMLAYNGYNHVFMAGVGLWSHACARFSNTLLSNNSHGTLARYWEALTAAAAALGPNYWSTAITSTSFWAVLLVVLLVFRYRTSGVHPPVDDSELGTSRRWIAVGTLVLAILVFMPSPLVAY